MLGPEIRGRAAQHETDLVGNACLVGGASHFQRLIGGEGQRLLAEHVPSCVDNLRQQALVFVGPGADVDGVAALDDGVLAVAARVTAGGGEGRGALGVRVVHARTDHDGATAPQTLRVVGGYQTRPKEADPNRGSTTCRHGWSACQTRHLEAGFALLLEAFDSIGDAGRFVEVVGDQ